MHIVSVDGQARILKVKGKLRHKHKPEIFIDSDLTEKERDIQTSIRKDAVEARSEGWKLKIRYKKI